MDSVHGGFVPGYGHWMGSRGHMFQVIGAGQGPWKTHVRWHWTGSRGCMFQVMGTEQGWRKTPALGYGHWMGSRGCMLWVIGTG